MQAAVCKVSAELRRRASGRRPRDKRSHTWFFDRGFHRIPDQAEHELLQEVMARPSKRAAGKKLEEYLATSLNKRRRVGEETGTAAGNHDFRRLGER